MTSYDSAVGRERGNPLREPFALLANHTAASPARKMPPRKLGNFGGRKVVLDVKQRSWKSSTCFETELQSCFFSSGAKLLGQTTIVQLGKQHSQL